VRCGGGWDDSGDDCEASYRFGNDPDDRSDDLGFRVLAVPVGG